jgi:hypothetical protein
MRRDGKRQSVLERKLGWFPLFSCWGDSTTGTLTTEENILEFCREERAGGCPIEASLPTRFVGTRTKTREVKTQHHVSSQLTIVEHETHKQGRGQGGCLGAEGRRRTRRPAKRSRGAAYKRGAWRIRMGQPVQSDVWTPPAEHIGRDGGQWVN